MSMLRLSEDSHRFALVAWLLYATTTFAPGDVRDGNRG